MIRERRGREGRDRSDPIFENVIAPMNISFDSINKCLDIRGEHEFLCCHCLLLDMDYILIKQN